MLKYIITTKCGRECPYCITKNMTVKEAVFSDFRLSNILMEAAGIAGLENIMLTGGEPTLSPDYKRIERMSFLLFNHVYLTTANPVILKTPMVYIEAVTFSMHDKESTNLIVESGNTVYASIMKKFYTPELPYKLKDQGFAGLTINENQRENDPFTEEIPEVKDFSIRVNRIGKCLDEIIILPNLEIINDFRNYLFGTFLF